MTEAVALYVHWPYCARICPYCDFNVVRARGREGEAETLFEAIIADLAAQAALIGPRPLASIFLGGGTPSLMSPAHVERLINAATGHFSTEADLEISLEANPTDAETARFRALRSAGVNRLSLGLQSLDDDALVQLGRNHDAAEGLRAAEVALEVFDRVSADLIYARPDQSLEQWSRELERTLALGFEHLSPYQLTIEPGTAYGRMASRGQLIPPGEDMAAQFFELTQSLLSAHGFEAYEVSNHARGAGARARHNMHIWRGGAYMGIGPGAHGRLALEGRTTTLTHRAIKDYVEAARHGPAFAQVTALSAADAAEERVLLAMRTVEGAQLADLEALCGSPVPSLAPLVDDGFLRLEGGRVIATHKARPVLDAVMAALLA